MSILTDNPVDKPIWRLQFGEDQPELKRGETMLATPSAPNRNLISEGSRMADAEIMAILSPKATRNNVGTMGGAA